MVVEGLQWHNSPQSEIGLFIISAEPVRQLLKVDYVELSLLNSCHPIYALDGWGCGWVMNDWQLVVSLEKCLMPRFSI